MNGVAPNDYRLRLDTGEDLLVTELDPETTPALADAAVVAEMQDVLEWCSFVSSEALEEAKRGFTRALQSELRSTPVGALLRLRTPVCGLIRSCGSADAARCTTRNIQRKRPAFPHCWEAEVRAEAPDRVRSDARAVASTIVHSWREGRRVLVVCSRNGRDLIPRTSLR